MVSIRVEPSAGSEIRQTFKEAIAIAHKLDCCIEFTFNDVSCLAYADGDPDKGASAYHEAIKSKVKYKLAMS